MDIKSLIEKLGGPARVGRICGISSQAVSQWERVPVERCIQIELASGGEVSRDILRPDIFGTPEANASVEKAV